MGFNLNPEGFFSNIGCFECTNSNRKIYHPNSKCLPVEKEREKAREKKKIVEMHEIGTDSRRDEFPDNILLIHSSM